MFVVPRRNTVSEVLYKLSKETTFPESFCQRFWFNFTLPALRSINGGSLKSSAKPRSSRDSCSRSRPTCCPSSKTRTWIVAKQPRHRAPNPQRAWNRTGWSPLSRTHRNNCRMLTLKRVKVTVWRKLQNPAHLSLSTKAPPPTLSQSERWSLAARCRRTDCCRMLPLLVCTHSHCSRCAMCTWWWLAAGVGCVDAL